MFNENTIHEEELEIKNTANPTDNVTAESHEEPAVPEKKYNSFKETLHRLKEVLPPDLYDHIAEIGSNRMGVSVNLSYPFKILTNTVIVKQLQVIFKNSGGYEHNLRLNIQLIAVRTIKNRPILKVRYVWSRVVEIPSEDEKGNITTRYKTEFIKQEVSMTPEQKRIASKLEEAFGFHSSYGEDVLFPFARF